MGDICEQRHKSSPAPVNFEFEDSRLGTKEYWDQFYDIELANFEDTGDEGEIWFGRSAEQRMLKFIHERVPLSARICDLGSGNGAFIRKLRDRGYMHLCGLDYSQRAVELAKRASSPSRILEMHSGTTIKLEMESGTIMASTLRVKAKANSSAIPEFMVADLTAEKLDKNLEGRFDILLDKGTLDAISLAPNRHSLLQRYQQNICHLFRSADETYDDLELLGSNTPATLMRHQLNRFLIIVSCNFTKDELMDLLETDVLRYQAELPVPAGTNSIKFGGKMGTTCTAVVFRWCAEEDD